MRASPIIKVEITTNRVTRLCNAFIGPQIHLLVLDAAPQPLDEDVIPPSPFAVHADVDGVAGEHAGECRAGELRTLIGVVATKLRFALRFPAFRGEPKHPPRSRRRTPLPS